MFDQQKNVFLMGFIADFMIAKLVNLVNKTATRVYGDYMGIINQLITAGGHHLAGKYRLIDIVGESWILQVASILLDLK